MHLERELQLEELHSDDVCGDETGDENAAEKARRKSGVRMRRERAAVTPIQANEAEKMDTEGGLHQDEG